MQHHPTRKRADVPAVWRNERTGRTAAGGDAHEGRLFCGCGLPHADRLACHALAYGQCAGTSAAPTSRSGTAGWQGAQGASLATPAAPRVERHGSGCATRDSQPRQAHSGGRYGHLDSPREHSHGHTPHAAQRLDTPPAAPGVPPASTRQEASSGYPDAARARQASAGSARAGAHRRPHRRPKLVGVEASTRWR